MQKNDSNFGQDTIKHNLKYFNNNLLDKILGKWNLTGKVGDRNVQNSLTAQWILNHQFIELNFAAEEPPPGYLAKVSIGYDCIRERYSISRRTEGNFAKYRQDLEAIEILTTFTK